jgi:hypothetical protein
VVCDRAVEVDVAAGDEGPGGGWIVGRGVFRPLDRERPVRHAGHAMDTEERDATPRQCAKARNDVGGAKEAKTVPVCGQVVPKRGDAARRDEPRSGRRPGGPDGSKDGVGVAGEDLDRPIAVALPGEDRRDIGGVRRIPRRPEARHRHDRDRAEDRGWQRARWERRAGARRAGPWRDRGLDDRGCQRRVAVRTRPERPGQQHDPRDSRDGDKDKERRPRPESHRCSVAGQGDAPPGRAGGVEGVIQSPSSSSIRPCQPRLSRK